jgi:hypothetical protein
MAFYICEKEQALLARIDGFLIAQRIELETPEQTAHFLALRIPEQSS